MTFTTSSVAVTLTHLDLRHIADIPLANVLIEMRCSIKHPSHIRDTADIPLADVLVEISSIDLLGDLKDKDAEIALT
jgi:hypothetical protein